MKKIQAPYLELGFYFEEISERIAFHELVKTLAGFGFKLGNRGYIFANKNEQATFASISDEVRQEVPINNWHDFDSLQNSNDSRLIQVVMNDMINNEEILITYISISPEAVMHDRHPIAIWSSGEIFTGTIVKHNKKQAKNKGFQIYKLLKDLSERLNPSYATITIGEPIECPTDLANDPRSYAFTDFYVNEDFLGSARLTKVKEMFTDAVTETFADGIYVSCYKFFNEKGKEVGNDISLRKSGEVARLIGSKSKRKSNHLNF